MWASEAAGAGAGAAAGGGGAKARGRNLADSGMTTVSSRYSDAAGSGAYSLPNGPADCRRSCEEGSVSMPGGRADAAAVWTGGTAVGA